MSDSAAPLTPSDTSERCFYHGTRAVEPIGSFMDDPNLTDRKFPGNPTRSYRSHDPLRVVREQLNWQGHSPAVIQAMKDGIAGLQPIDD